MQLLFSSSHGFLVFSRPPISVSIPWRPDRTRTSPRFSSKRAHVQIILDRSQRKERYSSADITAHAGIPTYIDAAHDIAHNKVMVIDKLVVITGSFNFTKAAEQNNAENLLVIRSREMARVYIENWEEHKGHSGF